MVTINRQAFESTAEGQGGAPFQTATVPRPARFGAVRDWWQLARPRIVAMVLVTMSVAAFVATPVVPSLAVLAHSLFGSALVIVGAIALNQQLERNSDGRMARTARRPLPSGRLTSPQVVVFGALTTAGGLAYLVALAPLAVAVLATVSWLLYVWMYTPLKKLSAWQTPLGAVAGAMPCLMGAAAAGAPPTGVLPLVLFLVVYFWQFPHAMAIAWLYRDDFAAASLQVATVVDPSGRTATRLSLWGAIALLPVTLAPCFAGKVGWGYATAGMFLSVVYLAFAVSFWRRPDNRSARLLLRVSLVYLPAFCAALVWAVRG